MIVINNILVHIGTISSQRKGKDAFKIYEIWFCSTVSLTRLPFKGERTKKEGGEGRSRSRFREHGTIFRKRSPSKNKHPSEPKLDSNKALEEWQKIGPDSRKRWTGRYQRANRPKEDSKDLLRAIPPPTQRLSERKGEEEEEEEMVPPRICLGPKTSLSRTNPSFRGFAKGHHLQPVFYFYST